MTVLGTLGLIFLVLKLLGIITWSWWLVLLPFYGGLVLLVLFALIGFTVAGLVSAVRNR